ncbi:MAG: glycosyl transferase family 2 [Planctomycetota bacterium]|nr:MAG: glycosyl transferase family 2 [Planctomycetota bacterium]
MADAARGARAAARIGVVIAAHDRERLLGRAMRSIYAQSLPPAAVELCVVDAASRDRTLEVARARAAEAPAGMRVVIEHEPSGGAAAARNRGWRRLEAAVVAFLDDDAEAAPDWLQSALAALEAEPRAGALGGPTRLGWLGPPPPRPLAEALAAFCALDYGPRRRWLRYPRAPIGPNMVVRRQALEQAGGFDPAFGPAPGRALVAEEGELCLRLQRAGYRVLYEPACRVRHLMEPRRAERSYVLWRAAVHGRSRCLVDYKHFGARRLGHQLVRLARGALRVALRQRLGAAEQADFVYGAAYLQTLAALLAGGAAR